MKKFKLIIRSVFSNGIAGTIKKIVNTKRQDKFIKYYYNNKTLSKAITIGEKLVKSAPDNLYHYQQLARAYWRKLEEVRAVETLKKGIKYKCGLELEEIISEIENNLSNSILPISHNFIFKGGHQNFGLIEHKYDNGILLTKIIRSNESSGDLLIKILLDRYNSLKTITPHIKNILVIKDLCFITMEKVDGQLPKQTDAKMMEKVFEINQIITNDIKYAELIEILEGKNQDPIIEPKNKHELFKALYLINHKEVLNFISRFLLKKNFPSEFLRVIELLNNKLIEGDYYYHINPKLHFSLQHGDFFRANMLQVYQTGDIKVIDWGGLKVGPRWVDIGIFLAVSRYPFEGILQDFLQHERCSYDSIERLFFIYTLIVTWIVSFDNNHYEVCVHEFLRPALNYFNTLMSQLESTSDLAKSL